MRKIAAVLAAMMLVPFGAAPAEAQRALKGMPRSSPCMPRATMQSEATPPDRCMRAIDAAKDDAAKAELYFYWAYALNDVGNFEAALPNLEMSAKLDPELVNPHFELAYTYGLLGEFDLSLAAADKAVKMMPNAPHLYYQRAYSRALLGDFAGQLADCDRAIAMQGTVDMYTICRAEALVGLGRYGEAEKALAQLSGSSNNARVLTLRADVKRMKGYKPKGNAADRCKLGQSLNQKVAEKLIADCSWAIVNSPDNAKKASYLTIRYMARVVVTQDPNSGLLDLGMAVALDPRNADLHFNYGSALVGANRNQAAVRELDKALALASGRPDFRRMVLLSRADAYLELDKLSQAAADAEEADGIKTSPDSQVMLGKIAFARGDKAKARQYWMTAWRMGRQDDALRANLRRVGVDDPALSTAN